eukprot:9908142-Alexandrium_andersonii.AAC.1
MHARTPRAHPMLNATHQGGRVATKEGRGGDPGLVGCERAARSMYGMDSDSHDNNSFMLGLGPSELRSR